MREIFEIAVYLLIILVGIVCFCVGIWGILFLFSTSSFYLREQGVSEGWALVLPVASLVVYNIFADPVLDAIADWIINRLRKKP